jgi:raffinose/stachyose/melibiose transport system substrate-binding protein
MQHMVKRKSAVICLILAVVLIVLSGCSGSKASNQNEAAGSTNTSANTGEAGQAAADSGEKIVLQVPETTVFGESSKSLEIMYKEFSKKHPNVELKQVNVSTDNIAPALAAGQAPDMLLIDPSIGKGLYKQGYLEPMDKYYDQFGWGTNMYGWARNAFKIDGKTIGVPLNFEGLMLMYNKDMFTKNGWAVPTNYNELVSLSFLSASAAALRLTRNPSNFVNDKQSYAITLDDAWDVFNNKKAAMKLEGTWALSRILNKDTKPPFNIGFFVMPTWRDGINPALPLGIGDAIGINAKTKHPEETAAFLDYYYSKEIASEYVKLGQFFHGLGRDLKTQVQWG